MPSKTKYFLKKFGPQGPVHPGIQTRQEPNDISIDDMQKTIDRLVFENEGLRDNLKEHAIDWQYVKQLEERSAQYQAFVEAVKAFKVPEGCFDGTKYQRDEALKLLPE